MHIVAFHLSQRRAAERTARFRRRVLLCPRLCSAEPASEAADALDAVIATADKQESGGKILVLAGTKQTAISKCFEMQNN